MSAGRRLPRQRAHLKKGGSGNHPHPRPENKGKNNSSNTTGAPNPEERKPKTDQTGRQPRGARARGRGTFRSSRPAGGTDRLFLEQEREEQRRADGGAGRLLKTFLGAVVLLERFPRCVLEINVTVLAGDGSLLAVAANAVMCALLGAGVPCRTAIAAVSVAVFAPPDKEILLPLASSGPSAEGGSSLTSLLLLDPTIAEEATDEVRSVATTTFILSNPNGGGGGVLASNMHFCPRRSRHVKSVSAKDFADMAALAARAAVTIFAFMQNCGVPLE
ncbi:Exoribonuclease [Trypanosoma melophagium]|uniref:Exoribonuclease n=1 Tax=Trypanosoma melophagium TaxID=715481 RepID=UPI00351A3EEE|nr:Exoribonuclease [Trypanosoma melophagium]